MRLADLAPQLSAEVEGDPAIDLRNALPLHEAKADSLTLVTDERNAADFLKSPCLAAIISMKLPPMPGKSVVRAADPLTTFIAAVRLLHPPAAPSWPGVHARATVHPEADIDPTASVGPNAVVGAGSKIGPNAVVHPGAVVGARCRIGDDSIIYPNAVLYDDTIVGRRVIIHAGAVLGADGFGFRPRDGRHEKVPQLGNVEIQDDVEIGANTTIDRATFGTTLIGEGTKIDNQVMIGHNCRVGPHNIFASQVGMAGSCTTGQHVIMAGQVGIKDHCDIGDKAILLAKCGVHKDVLPGQVLLGAPALPQREQMKIFATLERLPEMRRELKEVRDKLGLGGAAT